MARTTRASTALSTAGYTPNLTAVDQANGEQFANNGRKLLHVKNAGGVSMNVTITDQATVDGQAAPNRVVAVGAGAEKWIGPFPSVYNDSNGNVWVDYSTGTSVTAELVEAPLVS